jgi:hypothetical protein
MFIFQHSPNQKEWNQLAGINVPVKKIFLDSNDELWLQVKRGGVGYYDNGRLNSFDDILSPFSYLPEKQKLIFTEKVRGFIHPQAALVYLRVGKSGVVVI